MTDNRVELRFLGTRGQIDLRTRRHNCRLITGMRITLGEENA